MERLQTKYIDLNLNLSNSLKIWQEHSDSEDHAEKISTHLKLGIGQEGVVVKVKLSAIDRYKDDGLTITASDARNYGKVEGESVVFESSRELMPRIGFIKGKSYLMFDRAGGPTYAFFRPEDVESITSR